MAAGFKGEVRGCGWRMWGPLCVRCWGAGRGQPLTKVVPRVCSGEHWNCMKGRAAWDREDALQGAAHVSRSKHCWPSWRKWAVLLLETRHAAHSGVPVKARHLDTPGRDGAAVRPCRAFC